MLQQKMPSAPLFKEELNLIHSKSSGSDSFRTTIQYEGFMLLLKDSGASMDFQDFLNMCQTVDRLALDALFNIGVCDQYGRLRFGPIVTAKKIIQYYDLDMSHTTHSLYETMEAAFIHRGDLDLPDWLNMYPRSFLKIPLYNLAMEAVAPGRLVGITEKTTQCTITIPFSLLRDDYPDVGSVYNTTGGRMSFWVKTKNSYGNHFAMVITSNTDVTDEFFLGLYDLGVMLDDSQIVLGLDPKARANGKLLFSMNYKWKRGDKCNDHSDPAEKSEKEDW